MARPQKDLMERTLEALEPLDGEDIQVLVRDLKKFVEDKRHQLTKIREALKEIVGPLCLNEWFETPNDTFEGRTPAKVIEDGEMARLWEMVYRLKSGQPG